MPANTLRARVIFTGRVQGVFFRATSVQLARGLEVTGFVRNLPDGTVELEAQGAADEIEKLLEAIGAHYRANITDQARQEIPPIVGEPDFSVRY